jgi:2',3'-cyclic-nucleotide 2'-phosphodiesterase (5'-nucleotidase family)
MISRRDFLQTSMAAAALYGTSGFGNWARVAAQQALTQDKLLEFDTFGNVSLIHVTDIHAQLKPIYFREPSVNIALMMAALRLTRCHIVIFPPWQRPMVGLAGLIVLQLW